MSRRVRLEVVPLAALVAGSATVRLFSRLSPSRLDPVSAWRSPGPAHPLGCGEAGVDLLAFVSSASLSAVALGVAVALVGLGVGMPLGAAAAFRRGHVERSVERACDLVQAFPSFILALVVISAVRFPSRFHIGAVLALTAWAPFARLALAQTRVLRSAAFVEAARALGRTPTGILWAHVLPNLLEVAAVQLGATGAAVVVTEAGLAFVGFGPHDGISLGVVLDQGVSAMLRAPHVLVVGALAVSCTSAAMLAAGKGVARAC